MLDLYCGAGGASAGYAAAGASEIVGVDSQPQPRYPYTFVRADATTFPLAGFDLVHASPPCQRYARVTKWTGRPDDHPDLLGPTIERLRAAGVALWVVENVPEAIPRPDVRLCGTSFGLRVIRHRHFLTSRPVFDLMAPCWHAPAMRFIHKYERAYADALGVPWMTNREARQAIPPAYTEWLARRLW